MFIMFHFFFLQKTENNRLKKRPIGQNFVISIFGPFCLGSFGPVDQQINFVLPGVFSLKFIWDHFYITIIGKSIFLTGTSIVHHIWKCS